MKKIIAVSLGIVLSMVLVACSSPNDAKSDSNNQENEYSQGITVNNLEFDRILYENLSTEVQQYIEDNKYKKGYDLFTDEDGEITLIVYAGQRPSTGYSIKVVKIVDNEGITGVTLKETTPQDGEKSADVATVLTYPFDIVRFKGGTDNINIEYMSTEDKNKSDDNPKTNTNHPDSNLKELHNEGVFVGGIDNNSIEIEINGEPWAFRLTNEAKDYFSQNTIDPNSKVEFLYTINENNQYMLLKINTIN
ncbi:protease complex subunit PrcB family protein [Sporosalibacterium faouarense]|uniref:protease complex subunit PrcB family protein n=1 Tax=Sporosalibacterium faouarense TaxID=516123 RepID=UPI00141C6DC0|nr:protease complex subunit PrcB family protein [Sporosalibacterium faouarense]MTI48281.1 protease complex subunit PrcB family protein [Bacillota bacterium]